jgi:uncharacterized protein (AIM24 family)
MTTKANVVHPLYSGHGVLITEPTYGHKIIIDMADHKQGLILRQGLLYAYQQGITLAPIGANTVSGALFGGKGLFNLGVKGKGYLVLESPLPETEIVKIDIEKGEELRVDGPFAVMWDNTLTHSVELSTKTFIGSAVSGEGLVNVYRGEGSVWLELTAYVRDKNTATIKSR